ncbi:MAG TPA: hypothetical protein VJN93_12095 [Candidatus Acidoferrum sp.]|nr:hypothetical protein [Candidatus Acidoferrum sp.]
MPSLTPKDRLSLCRFSFADGRLCRTPRVSSSPHFCFYHAQKEAESQAVASLADEFSRIFSGVYISANDLTAALARLVPAVLQGHIKPRTARTLAYLTQTLLQTIRLSQHEFIHTFGNDAWRKAVSHSVHANRNLRIPRESPADSQPAAPLPAPAPAENSGESTTSPAASGASPTQAPQPRPRSSAPRSKGAAAHSPQTPLPDHRQPETVAAALAVARSRFPQRPAAQPASD